MQKCTSGRLEETDVETQENSIRCVLTTVDESAKERGVLCASRVFSEHIKIISKDVGRGGGVVGGRGVVVACGG